MPKFAVLILLAAALLGASRQQPDPRFWIVAADGALINDDIRYAVEAGFWGAWWELGQQTGHYWPAPEDFVFIAHPVQISQPATGFWSWRNQAYVGGYFEFWEPYWIYGLPEIHFVADWSDPTRVRLLNEHELGHGIGFLLSCPNWYQYGHGQVTTCY